MTEQRWQTAQPRASRHPITVFLMRVMVWLLYSSVEVAGPLHVAERGPVLGVSTHFGGLPDPLLIVDVVRRWPRFMGKDVIFKTPLIGWLARYLDGIPVHQPSRSETDPEAANRRMFAAAHEALARSSLVVIFPEGVTPESPAMSRVRTGAARIALGARADGTSGILVLPIAIHYADRKTLRSRVFVNVGEPLDLDEWVATNVPADESQGSGNHAAVDALTDDVETRMRAIAPDFSDWREAHLLQLAAETALRDESAYPADPVGYAERETLAGALNRRATEAQKESLIASASGYDADLRALNLTDQSVVQRTSSFGSFLGYLAWTVLAIVVLTPFAIAGFAVNIVPLVLVWLVGRLRLSDPMMSSVKPAAAILSFGAAWGIALWSAGQNGFVYLVGTVVLLPVFLLALIVLSERLVGVLQAFRLRRRVRGMHGMYETIHAERSALVTAVREVVPAGFAGH